MSTDTPRVSALYASKLDGNEIFAWRNLATNLERELAAAREKVAAFMLGRGLATGHGDTIDDLLGELGWQIDELAAAREECDALRVDAERYRWLTSEGTERRWTFWLGRNEPDGYSVWPVFGGDSIDAAIDAARK